MTSRDFCYWLQGYFEIAAANKVGATPHPWDMTADQVQMVQKHLALVFKHEIDPSQGSKEHQAALNAIHSQQPSSPKAQGFSKPLGFPSESYGGNSGIVRC